MFPQLAIPTPRPQAMPTLSTVVTVGATAHIVPVAAPREVVVTTEAKDRRITEAVAVAVVRGVEAAGELLKRRMCKFVVLLPVNVHSPRFDL